jgi:hypothetical protein
MRGIKRALQGLDEDDDDLPGMDTMDEFWMQGPRDLDVLMQPDLYSGRYEELADDDLAALQASRTHSPDSGLPRKADVLNLAGRNQGWSKSAVATSKQVPGGSEDAMREKRDAMTKRIMELGGHIKTMRAQGANRWKQAPSAPARH